MQDLASENQQLMQHQNQKHQQHQQQQSRNQQSQNLKQSVQRSLSTNRAASSRLTSQVCWCTLTVWTIHFWFFLIPPKFLNFLMIILTHLFYDILYVVESSCDAVFKATQTLYFVISIDKSYEAHTNFSICQHSVCPRQSKDQIPFFNDNINDGCSHGSFKKNII